MLRRRYGAAFMWISDMSMGLQLQSAPPTIAIVSNWQPDPRGFSSEKGMKLLTTAVLSAMKRGTAGEGQSVVNLASNELRRRAQVEALVEQTPLWSLSPYERALHRDKGATLKQSGSYYALS